MNARAGFTLTELLIGVAIVGILAGVALVSLNGSTALARDAERQADLRSLQSAVELYKLKYGRYPAGCRDSANYTWNGVWSGQNGSGYECSSGNQYIVGLAPEFIPVLPTDPKLNSNVANSGYVYTTNPAGTVYKIMVLNTVESEQVVNGEGPGDPHPFSRCGDIGNSNLTTEICTSVPSAPTGNPSRDPLDQCTNVSEYSNDYAVSGGFAPGGHVPVTNSNPTNYRETTIAREYFTDVIRCK